MKYYCVEHEECGFADQTFDATKYQELICPHCFSPLVPYPEDEKPIWERTKTNNTRSDER